VDVNDVTTGARTVILKLRSADALALVVVALTVNVDVVSDPTAPAVPVIAPVVVLKFNPVGIAPVGIL
jgi:hypothetical protein